MFGKKRYINWEEYAGLIAAREMLHHISNTAEESVNNYWKKRGG